MTDDRSSNKNGLAETQRRTWIHSLKLLKCAVPTEDKSWNDLPRFESRVPSDNRLLSPRTVSTSSSSLQQERRQSISPSLKANEIHEHRHSAKPLQFDSFERQLTTPPVAQKKEMSPHQRINDYDPPATNVVTPEEHIEFIRDVFGSYRSRELPKEKGLPARSEDATNRILLPVLDESPGRQFQQPGISLHMRRNSDNLEGLEFVSAGSDIVSRKEYRYNEIIETRNVITPASGVWHKPQRSVKSPARSDKSEITFADEWKLLQEANQQIANVKEFLRAISLQTNDDNEVQDIGIETLLLQDNHVALIEDSALPAQSSKRDTRFPRRTSFGEKPPRPPQSPKEYSRSSTSPKQHLVEF
ncbi:hypothetical protein FisN_40Hh025 [Fistulifera solaris]|jgi:hypothetical protein|uniref:Uncharacterized protein n=1 Tax=Fistulifera solaris TaxID=1519565 RepID=A0A1Z5K6S6_FISSO|nr:hypothetical protein FisN_40Hh025 [Fistulifera solaris]|eukprot:GAX21926.1 hypothetical protein FisN_40Hh025 [Fistulifera solaris]